MVEPKKGTKWPKELPKFKSRPDAIAVCKELCGRQFMHRSEKVGKGELEVRSYIIMFTFFIANIRGYYPPLKRECVDSGQGCTVVNE